MAKAPHGYKALDFDLLNFYEPSINVACWHFLPSTHNGILKDATDITFYESESDEKPLPSVSGIVPSRCSARTRNTNRFTKSLAAQKAEDDRNTPIQRRSNASTPRPRIKHIPESPSDEEDEDFDDLPALEDVLHSSDEGESDSEDFGIDHDEVCRILNSALGVHSNTILFRLPIFWPPRQSQTRVKPIAPKRRRATVEEVENEADLERPAKSKRLRMKTIFNVTSHYLEYCAVQNPIYLFYETVPKNENGSIGDPGDKHYKCHHGNRKIITITKGMRYNVTKLVNHLKSTFPIMSRLFLALYTRKDERPTQAEIDLAHGNVPADAEAAKVYLGTVETTTSNILKSLEAQAKKVHEKTHV
ncbi:hypothetical protein K438DRAFT_1773969 [Mycena galopus ATCC 62051]|nr:hypothetical protein K438DRAFT_1773969 [Mycena galopus ATCC 62051]